MEKTNTSLACRKQFFSFAYSCWLMPRLKVGPICVKPLLCDYICFVCTDDFEIIKNLWSSLISWMYCLFIFFHKISKFYWNYGEGRMLQAKFKLVSPTWVPLQSVRIFRFRCMHKNTDSEIHKLVLVSSGERQSQREQDLVEGNILPHKSQLYCTRWESLCCASSQEVFPPTMPLSVFFFSLWL